MLKYVKFFSCDTDKEESNFKQYSFNSNLYFIDLQKKKQQKFILKKIEQKLKNLINKKLRETNQSKVKGSFCCLEHG